MPETTRAFFIGSRAWRPPPDAADLRGAEEHRSLSEGRCGPARGRCAARQRWNRLRPLCKKRKNGIRRFRANHRDELFSRGAPHAADAPELRQKGATPRRPDTRDAIQLGRQVTERPSAPVERDGESMGLIANPLNEQKRRIVG